MHPPHGTTTTASETDLGHGCVHSGFLWDTPPTGSRHLLSTCKAIFDVGSVPDLGATRRRVCSRRQPRAKHASFEKQFPCGNAIRSVLCNVVCAQMRGTIRSVLPRHCARLRQCRGCQTIFPVCRYLDVCLCQRRRAAPMGDGADTCEAHEFRTQIFLQACAGAGLRRFAQATQPCAVHVMAKND